MGEFANLVGEALDHEANCDDLSAALLARLRGAVEILQRRVAIAERRESNCRKYWLRAGKSALEGDMRDLRIQVGLAEEPPVAVVLSGKEPTHDQA